MVDRDHVHLAGAVREGPRDYLLIDYDVGDRDAFDQTPVQVRLPEADNVPFPNLPRPAGDQLSKGQAEPSVLFELISARYERRSTLITANQPFGAWGKVFPDPAMTLAAADRLVHHATIFGINVDSYLRRAALDRKSKSAGRPQAYATIKDLDTVSRTDNQPPT